MRRQAQLVVARGSSAAAGGAVPAAGAIPASDRAPDPRARPSRTVSAWSSRVWASSTTSAPSLVGHVAQCVVPGGPGGSLGPALVADLDGATRARVRAPETCTARPRSRHVAGLRLQPVVDDHRPGPQSQLRRLESGRRRSASESAPPEHATSTVVACGRSASAVRAPPPGPWRPPGAACRGLLSRGLWLTQASGSAISFLVGSVLRAGPDRVEAVHADLVDHPADEGRAVLVLAHLGVQAEQPLQHLVQRVAARRGAR